MTAVATAARVERPLERQVPAVEPRDVLLNVDGLVLRELVVRLPADFEASDLGSPELWTKVQRSPKALRKLDRLVMISFDEGWCWTAIVSEAGPAFANLARPERYELKARLDRYYEDDNYRVVWNGSQFAIVRKSDGFTMPERFTTHQEAERGVAKLYPKPV